MFDMVVATTVSWCRRDVGLHVARRQQQDAIAVDHLSGCIGEHGAIGIAIEGDAQIVLSFRGGDRLGNVFGIECAASRIDVAAVRLDVQEVGGYTAIAKHQRSNRAGRSVGAIDQNSQFAEIGGGNEVSQPLGILFPQCLVAGQHVATQAHCV